MSPLRTWQGGADGVPSQNLIRRLRTGMEVVREVEGSQFDTAAGRS